MSEYFRDRFKKSLHSISENSFEQSAIELFQYQAVQNKVYASYIDALQIDVTSVTCIDNIPFIPIHFYKTEHIVSGLHPIETVFESSKTTGTVSSKHYVLDSNWYLQNSESGFKHFYGPLEQYVIFALLPGYLERQNSSLVFMADYFIKKTQNPLSGFYLNNHQELYESLTKAKSENKKILLLGVTFGLLDFIEAFRPNLSDCIVMETGGMKGRREELTREELHSFIQKLTGCTQIHSEYGMTELLSQAYSTSKGLFKCPPWMKIRIRDIMDPFDLTPKRSIGGINIIDLANIDSCAFIETQDVGKLHHNGEFEVIGRIDQADVRGCNLMIV